MTIFGSEAGQGFVMIQNAYGYANMSKSKTLLGLSKSAKCYVSMETVVQVTILRIS